MSETVSTTGKSFVEFWPQQAAKGELNANTAGALRAAVKAVIEVDDDWETRDVRSLDVESLLRRFTNKKGTEMKGDSIRAYLRRFQQAYASFITFADNPAAWRPPVQGQPAGRREGNGKGEGRNGSAHASKEITETSAPGTPVSAIEYPFPLRGGAFVAKLRLPTDLSSDEVRRLTAYMQALAVTPAAED
jgi:hypothetical protein